MMLADVLLPFPWPLSTRQTVYLFGMQGVLACCVDFGANFGIAYAMYSSQTDVRMWVFAKNTIAGDLGVTPLIQCAASMVITSTLVHTDLHSKAIRPLPFVYPHVERLPDPRGFFRSFRKGGRRRGEQEGERGKSTASTSTSSSTATTPPSTGVPPSTEKTLDPDQLELSFIAFYALMFLRFTLEGTEASVLLSFPPSSRPTVRGWFGRLGWTVLQGLAIGVVFGLPLWALAVLILGPIYGNGNMGNIWAPQAIKGVYGGLLGLITNPVIATLTLGSQAEHHLIPLASEPTDAESTMAAGAESADLPPASRPTDASARRPSVASSSRRRPSITANPSTLAVLSPPGSLGPSITPRSFPPGSPTPLPSPAIASVPTPSSPAKKLGGGGGRPRAGTTSSEYSLGGTGGRAQRPRAGSRSSVFSMSGTQGTAGIGGPEGRDRASSIATTTAGARPVPSAWTTSGVPSSSSTTSAPPPPASPKKQPTTATTLASQAGRVRAAEALDVPRESLEIREGHA